ncbi:MAG TPA: hypothetical protein VE224_20925 [Pseudolabrys sp.]|nr:hypothetical protein [Pseudolabrys sp.]
MSAATFARARGAPEPASARASFLRAFSRGVFAMKTSVIDPAEVAAADDAIGE